MTSFLAWLGRRIAGERRHRRRDNSEHVQVVNRQYAAAAKLARKLHTTPEALLDYRRADRVLGRR